MTKLRFSFLVAALLIASAGLVSGKTPDARPAPVRDIGLVGPRTENIEPSAYAQVLYVSGIRGSDQEGDGSKAKPWKSIVHALASITGAAESRRIAVFCGGGTYDGGTIHMKSFVDLFGGFNPSDWTREISVHRSVLDGQRIRRVVAGADKARIDGFTITRGVARSHGGGILCEDTSPTISNNVIADNLVLEPADFNHGRIHQDGHHGGGVACLYNAVPVIRNNLIYGNRTSVGCGAGVAFYGWRRGEDREQTSVRDNRLTGGEIPLLENNVIIGNLAGVNDSNRSRSSNGAGVSCSHEARPIVRNNVIAGNQALGRGDAGGIYSEYYSDPWIVGNWVVGNSCEDDGGGFYTMRLGHPLLEKNIFAGNWSTVGGVGGVRLSKEGRATLRDNLIVHNQTGGGLNSDNSFLELKNNVIMHNRGGGGLLFALDFSYFMPSVVVGNVLRENQKAAIQFRGDAGKRVIVEDNNVQGGYQGKGNRDVDPGFAEDGQTGTVSGLSFDEVHGTTLLSTGGRVSEPASLAGRVIRVGARWGVIREAAVDRLTVWGDLRPQSGDTQARAFQIIPSYR